MLIVMNSDATDTDIRRVVEIIEALGFKAHPMPGENRTAIGLTGNQGAVDPAPFAELPGVAECAGVGVPDDKTGEAVKLVIVKRDANLSEEQVREFCRGNLTGYKQPKLVEFRTELPKTPVGKILRRELRDKK